MEDQHRATNPAHGYIKANNTDATTYTEIYTSVYDKNGQALVTLNEVARREHLPLRGRTDQHLEPLRVEAAPI